MWFILYNIITLKINHIISKGGHLHGSKKRWSKYTLQYPKKNNARKYVIIRFIGWFQTDLMYEESRSSILLILQPLRNTLQVLPAHQHGELPWTKTGTIPVEIWACLIFWFSWGMFGVQPCYFLRSQLRDSPMPFQSIGTQTWQRSIQGGAP